ncbi:hypothetical protein HBA54_10115 [Pelagibius litoralis]|uniref:Uncharacterized protein n=1 Tax=Pelagibius litoralis TaxID=374515 RepID=A0A967C997_9PROT|nr:hypothetical protein [Pelagibius litoralis]NIA68947.1 hypothetical protein [Pelagibius litoralis]
MSEILLYSMTRAGGKLPPPGISDPFAPRARPLYRRRKRRPSRTLAWLRRFAGRRLLGLGAGALRLGQRWATPVCETAAVPRLRALP